MRNSAEQLTPSEKPHQEIPLAYRMAHLNIDTSVIYPKTTAAGIAGILDIDDNLVNGVLKKFNIEPDPHDEQYPSYVTDFIREERAWRSWYMALPAKLNTAQIAEAVGRSQGWTAKTLVELYPNVRQQKTGHRSRFYPRVAVEKLRDITMATAPDQSWYTIPQLIEATGRERGWILNRLRQAGLRSEVRQHPLIGRECPFYPPDSIDVLLEALQASAPPAGNWLTAYAMINKTGKSSTWINKRLKREFWEYGELRLDDMGVERIHYPLSVLDALREKIRAEEAAQQERLGRKAIELYESAA